MDQGKVLRLSGWERDGLAWCPATIPLSLIYTHSHALSVLVCVRVRVCVCVRERERESECGCVSLSVFMCLSHSVLCVCVSHRRDCFSRLCQGKSEDVSQTKKVEFLSFSQKEENLVKNLYSSKTRQNGNILFGRFWHQWPDWKIPIRC